MWLELIVDRLVAELCGAGIVDPLAQPFTLAAIVADLFALVESPLPPCVAELLGATH